MIKITYRQNILLKELLKTENWKPDIPKIAKKTGWSPQRIYDFVRLHKLVLPSKLEHYGLYTEDYVLIPIKKNEVDKHEKIAKID